MIIKSNDNVGSSDIDIASESGKDVSQLGRLFS